MSDNKVVEVKKQTNNPTNEQANKKESLVKAENEFQKQMAEMRSKTNVIATSVSGGKETQSPNLQVLNNNNTMTPTLGRREQVANYERSAITVGGREIMNTIGQAGEAGQGFSKTIDVTMPATAVVLGLARARLNAPLKTELIKEYGTSDVTEIIKEINKDLKQKGYEPINAKGTRLSSLAGRQLRRAKAQKMPQSVIDQYKKLKDIGDKTVFSGKSRIFRRTGFRAYSSVTRYLKQCEAGQGFSFVTNIVVRGRQTLRVGVKAMRTTARAARIVAQKTALTTARLALKAAKRITKNAKPGGTVDKTVRKAKYVSTKARSRAKSASNKVKKVTNKASSARKRFREFRRDPLHIKRGFRKLSNKFTGYLLKKSPLLRKIAKMNLMRSKVMSTVVRAFGALIKYIILGILGIILLSVVISAIVSLISGIAGIFDFGNSNEEIREAAIEQLQECYREDLEYIQNLSGYDNITLSFCDIKDEETYETRREDNGGSESFYQSTNCAEILAMAYVRYDYDFEENTNKNEVKNFVRNLYRASHTTDIAETTWTETDANGNEVTHKSANVTYTTYYFDYLFDCRYTANSIVTYSNGSYATTNVQSMTWDFLINQGFTKRSAAAVMGNIQQESSFDPENTDGTAHGLLQWQGGRLTNLKNYANERNADWKNAMTQLSFFVERDAEPQFQQYTGVEPYVYPNGSLAWWPDRLTLNDYKQLTNIDKATEIFERVFERASVPKMESRKAYARTFYERYKNRDRAQAMGEEVAAYACTYAGRLPYVWGGSDLTTGCDCSGFVSAIYQEYNINIPKGTQNIITASSLYTVSWGEAMPGDIIVTTSSASASGKHTGIYIGNGQWVNAATDSAPLTGSDLSKTQTRINNVPVNNIICVRRPSFNN